MRKDIDITALGELLIDFTEAGQSEDGQKLFEQNPGGAPANLLTAASHMGCKTALWTASRIAKQSGALISYDPNYRSSLWKDPETAIHEIKQALPLADLLKVSEEESALLTGCSNYQEAAKQLLTTGPRFIAVTLGENGVFLASAQKTEQIPGFLVPCVDTTGAGDSFWGGFLSTLLTLPKPLEQLDWEDLKKWAITGNAVAALCIQKRGGIPSIPEKEKVTAFLSNHI